MNLMSLRNSPSEEMQLSSSAAYLHLSQILYRSYHGYRMLAMIFSLPNIMVVTLTHQASLSTHKGVTTPLTIPHPTLSGFRLIDTPSIT